MAKYYVVRFSDDLDEAEDPEDVNEYVAYGIDKDALPVFHMGESSHVETMMEFPGCLRFMPYMWVGEFEEMGHEEILVLYGERRPLKGPSRSEMGYE